MPIKELQQRFTQVGVIRLGRQLLSRNNKPYPAKLETLRFTSPSKSLIEAVAGLYGGTAAPWASTVGAQWEVITGVREIPVLVPPQTIDPNYEHWGNGYRDRLCDGATEQIRCQSCLCRAQWGDEFAQKAPVGQACKPTTRMSLMLADVVSLGTWKLESHGWNAAAELPMLAAAIAAAPQPIPARLEVQTRQKKILHPTKPKDEQIESRTYMVPVLHFDFVTPAQAFSGQIGAAAQKALGVQERVAIEASPAEGSALTNQRVYALAKLYTTREQIEGLTERAKAAGVLDDALHRALTDRWKRLPAEPSPSAEPAQAEAAPAAVSTGPATPDVPPAAAEEQVIEAEEEPDTDALWTQILGAAGKRKWNADALEQRILATFNKPSDEINGWQMAEFLKGVKSGDIA
jgi:hypothetical protein